MSEIDDFERPIDSDPVKSGYCGLEIAIRRKPDGLTHRFDYDIEADYPRSAVEYAWAEGNYACDHNRHLFFWRAVGVEPERDENMGCDTEIYWIDYIKNKATGEVLYSEIED